MEANYRYTNPVLHYSLLGFIYAVGALTLLTHALMGGMSGMGATSAQGDNVAVSAGPTSCNGTPTHTYTIAFTNNGFAPDHVTAERCDELSIKDTSRSSVLPALGPHDHHITYPGFKEVTLQPGQTYSFRLNEAGSFPMHDHITDLYHATLVVK